MLSTCQDFNRAWKRLEEYGSPRVYTKVYTTAEGDFATVYIAGYNVQSITFEGSTTILTGNSNIAQITKRVKRLLPTIYAIEVYVEYEDRTYSAYREGPVSNPEVVTNLFKQVVIKVCREKLNG